MKKNQMTDGMWKLLLTRLRNSSDYSEDDKAGYLI